MVLLNSPLLQVMTALVRDGCALAIGYMLRHLMINLDLTTPPQLHARFCFEQRAIFCFEAHSMF